jgi:hypothetical protein
MTFVLIATLITVAPGTAGLLLVAVAGLAYKIGRDVGRRG